MNDNDIIKAFDILDKFEFFGGQRAGRELWFNKPADIQEKDIVGFNRDIDFLKAFINRQEAEIERLQKYNTDMARKHYNDGIREFAKKLTVEAIAKFDDDNCFDGYSVAIEDIDNLVKEMTEGEDESVVG